MAAAYAYAEGGSHNQPAELTKLFYIDRFGPLALVLPYGEMKRMVIAEHIVKGFRARARAAEKDGGWVKWANDHEYLSGLLNRAMDAARQEEPDHGES